MGRKPYKKQLFNVMMNDMRGLCKKYDVPISDCGITPEDLSWLVKIYNAEMINKKQLFNILERRIKNEYK